MLSELRSFSKEAIKYIFLIPQTSLIYLEIDVLNSRSIRLGLRSTVLLMYLNVKMQYFSGNSV